MFPPNIGDGTLHYFIYHGLCMLQLRPAMMICLCENTKTLLLSALLLCMSHYLCLSHYPTHCPTHYPSHCPSHPPLHVCQQIEAGEGVTEAIAQLEQDKAHMHTLTQVDVHILLYDTCTHTPSLSSAEHPPVQA